MRKYFILVLFTLLFYVQIFAAEKNNKTAGNLQNKNKINNNNQGLYKKNKLDKIHVAEQNFKFNFQNKPLVNFARYVAKLTDKILIGEELLKGNIDIISEGKLNKKEVIEIFREVLYSKNLDYIETKIQMAIIQRNNSVVKVYRLKYLKSDDLAKNLSQMFRMSFKVGNQPTNIQISSIKTANALMVLAPKEQQREIEKSIKKLDVRGKQVLLKMMILEITKRSIFGFGVDLGYNGTSITNTNGTIAGLTSLTQSTPPLGGSSSVATPATTFTTATASPSGTFGYSNGGFTFNIHGVDNNTKIKLLSQPRVMATNNKKSTLKIGSKFPYIKGSASTGTSSGSGTTSDGGGGYPSTSSTVSTLDLGLELDVTPRINGAENVTLETKLTIKDKTTDIKVPNGGLRLNRAQQTAIVWQVTNKNFTNSSNVRSGTALVIGGFIKNSKTTEIFSPPVLGSLPYVGWMFSKEDEIAEQTELIVIILPTIISNSSEGEVVVKNEANELKNYDPEEKATVQQMLSGKKGLTDDVFNIFEYYRNGKYRSEQDFIPQPINL